MTDNRFIAIYKTFRGNEFLEASIESIYNHVDLIVFVNSDTSWTGDTGNDCIEVINRWKEKSDDLNKIVCINGSYSSQLSQYNAGMDFIKTCGTNHNYVMVVDTDEVWDEENILRAKEIIDSNPAIDSFTCQMYTYIKSPFYRLSNIEPCKPVVFVKKGLDYIDVRFNQIKNKMLMENVFFHHFTYVRKYDELVFEKIITSNKADKEKVVDLDLWKKEKWNMLPNSTNFHCSRGYEHYWKGITEVTRKDLPEVLQVRDHEILKLYYTPKPNQISNKTSGKFSEFRKSFKYKNIPKGSLLVEDEYILYEYSLGSNLSVEIGTAMGRSATILSEASKKVISVDIFENISLIEDPKNREHYTRFFNENPHSFLDVSKNLHKYSNIILKYRLPNCVEGEIDFLFLDADHSYEGVKRDFEEFFPNVKSGGIVAFHDSLEEASHPHHEVYKFLEELKESKNIKKIDSNGSVTIWRKL